MTLTVNKKTYEAGELVAYVEKLEKENANLNANLKVLRKYELNIAKLEIEKLEKENAELRTKTTALENANRVMVKELDDMTSGGISVLKNVVRSKEQLTKAEQFLKECQNEGR